VRDPVTSLVDGRLSFNRIIACIESATRSIEINMFIWRDDPLGNRIGQALLDAADRDVAVTITKDRLGAIFELGEESRQSYFHKQHGPYTALKQYVINAYSSRPDLFARVVQRPNRQADQLRAHKNISISDAFVRNDHSKFTIIDEEILFIGGMNFEERMASTDASGLIWQDYMLEFHSRVHVKNLKQRLSGMPRGHSRFEFILNDIREPRRFEVKPCVVDLLNGARETCQIEMAYVGDPDVSDCLVNAAGRGVDIQIIVPARANIQNELNLKTMREIFQRTAGKVAIYLSSNMTHAKMMDIDSHYMFVGSANFNERALSYFSELNVLITGDPECAETIRRTFVERRDASRLVSCADQLSYRRAKAFCEHVFG